MNMAGSGFPKAAGVTKQRSVIIGLQKLWWCPHLHAAAELLSLGIDLFDKFGAFCSKLKVAAKNNPGALGPYHRKLVLDQVVAARFVPSTCVSSWPVAPGAGTMDGLQLLHPKQIRTPVQAGVALNEVWHRLKRKGVLRNSDHPGTIGAALCFLKRKKKKSGDGSRMKTTVIYWKEQLQNLQEAGIVIDEWD